ncbi:MAG: redoxin domain-containing protein [Bacteroidales bacterium]|nr:redoxin domain-containing protein [Bacteroidales bacterium]MDD7088116.1 redoxin domain-containing protein [Bacteroidales bacterium]MDY2936136.1 redoxin domain-containing protein [Candidatus Cryptobacteroides sp.]
MKNCSFLLMAGAIAMLSSCSQKSSINGTLTGAKDAEVVVKELNGASTTVLDTVKTNANGAYSYKMNILKGQPEFIYLYKGNTKIASLLLSNGDKVRVVSDTLGNYSVEGSEESVKLQQVEKDFASFMKSFSEAAERGDNKALSQQYVDYYRSRVKYIMGNPKSLTSIPVLYQKINDNFPVFSQQTDAIHFRNVYDSLKTVYPNSKYVAALGEEAKRRENLLSLGVRMENVKEMAFPDLDLPSIDGTKKKLSEVQGKVIMVYFWQAADAAQKMFNKDVLIPVYKEYHPKGLEIYSVSLDTDKGAWASVVKSQELPWINVCDGLGAGSQGAVLYNVGRQLPVAYLIIDGELSDEVVRGKDDLQRVLNANLR